MQKVGLSILSEVTKLKLEPLAVHQVQERGRGPPAPLQRRRRPAPARPAPARPPLPGVQGGNVRKVDQCTSTY